MATLARRVISFMLTNKNTGIAVQKRRVPGVSRCMEHTSTLTRIIQEARENKGNLTVLRLDLANAYGSIPYKLV